MIEKFESNKALQRILPVEYKGFGTAQEFTLTEFEDGRKCIRIFYPELTVELNRAVDGVIKGKYLYPEKNRYCTYSKWYKSEVWSDLNNLFRSIRLTAKIQDEVN